MVEIISPEIETIVEDEEEEEVLSKEDLEKYLIEIRKNPYNYICNYVESVYPHIGNRVFRILSLSPVSLIIPDIPFMGKTIRSNINVLFLSPPGTGKTSLAKLFSSLTLNPLEVESITPAGMEDEISKHPKFTMIVGDFARMARDPLIIKILEGVLGEEKRIKRKTMKKDLDMETEGICLLAGTLQDLSHYLSGGLLFRVCPIIILISPKEHSEIGEHIKNRIGEDGKEDEIEEAIKTFYKELELIQDGKHPNIKPIKGYYIPQEFKDRGYEEWKKLTDPIVKFTNFSFVRGFQELFRFMICHSFLNIYNRKVERGKIVIEKEDFEIGIKLMKETINLQYDILKTERYAKSLKNLKELQIVLSSNQIDDKYKRILKNLVAVKSGRVSLKR